MATASACLPGNIFGVINFGAYFRKTTGPTPETSEEYIQALFKEWIEKRIRAHNKASWAAQVRWCKKRGEIPSKPDANAVAESILEKLDGRRAAVNRWLANSQKRIDRARKAAQARWGKKRGAASMPNGAQRGLDFPPSYSPGILTSELSCISSPLPPNALPPAAAQWSEIDRRAAGRWSQDGFPHQRASASVAGRLDSIVRGQRTRLDRQKQDPRFGVFCAAVLEFWTRLNPNHPECPWNRKDTKALEQLLEGSPSLTLETLQRWLDIRSASDITPSDLPRHWLADLARYSSGPLNWFKQPLSAKKTGGLDTTQFMWKGPQ